jgi:hypothetical protein
MANRSASRSGGVQFFHRQIEADRSCGIQVDAVLDADFQHPVAYFRLQVRHQVVFGLDAQRLPLANLDGQLADPRQCDASETAHFAAFLDDIARTADSREPTHLASQDTESHNRHHHCESYTLFHHLPPFFLD